MLVISLPIAANDAVVSAGHFKQYEYVIDLRAWVCFYITRTNQEHREAHRHQK